MSTAKVQINELRLRASGLTPEQARSLGEGVAKRLTESPLDGNRQRTIPTMNVHVRLNALSSIERMAEEIALGIQRRLD